MKIFPHQLLSQCDLVVDAIYESSGDGQIGGEPISKILPGSGNMGGFRVSGRGERKNWVVLFSTGEDRDWPDTLDLNTGRFVYYGDNKTPGHELHDTEQGVTRFFVQYSPDFMTTQDCVPMFHRSSCSRRCPQKMDLDRCSSKVWPFLDTRACQRQKT